MHYTKYFCIVLIFAIRFLILINKTPTFVLKIWQIQYLRVTSAGRFVSDIGLICLYHVTRNCRLPGLKEPRMKNLNSLLAFALLVLVVAGCGSSSNNNSNSSNSSNSNSLNNDNANKSANTSSTDDKDTKGVFHDDKAGIRLQAPEGWTTKLNGEQLTMSPPDDSIKIITWVPEEIFSKRSRILRKSSQSESST